MTLQTLILIGWLISAPWTSTVRQDENPDRAEQRLENLMISLDDLGETPAPGEELYFNMECGLALLELERYPMARPHFERAAVLAREIKEPGMLVMSLSSLVEVSFQVGELERAKGECTEAMAMAVAMHRDDHVARLASSLGSIELRIGNYSAAVDALSRALEASGDLGDPQARAALLSNLAVAYMSLSRFDEALEALDRALPLMEEADSPEGIAAILSNQGDVLLLAGDPKTGLAVMNEALALRLEHDLVGDSSISYRSIGQARLALGQPKRALASFDRALGIQRRLQLRLEVVATLAGMAKAYAALDRFGDAEAAAIEGVQLAETTRMRDRHVLALDSLAQAYEGQGDLEQALRCERKARELQGEQVSGGLARALAGFQARYDAQQRAHDLVMLRKESDLSRQQRNFQLFGTGLLMIVALAGWISFLKKRRMLTRLDQVHGDLRLANASTLAHSEQLERAMLDVQTLEEERLRAGKFESLGFLAAGIAHDFNNMLAVVLGNVSMTKRLLQDRPNEEEMLVDAEAAIRQGRRLSSQLLAFSKGGEPLRKLQALPTLLRESAGLSASGSRARLSFNLSPDLWPAEIDVGQVSQLISNLVLNAIQATPGGGTIEIGARNVPAASDPGNEGPLVRICITDSGPGIPDEIRQKIFDPYFTTKGEGSGLGLTTAYAIASRHGGTIRVLPGAEGAVFECDLPAVPDGLVEELDGVSETPRGSGRVLVLDDDPLVCTFYKRALTRLEYEPVVVSSADDALAAFDQATAEGNPFGTVILDLTLPGDRDGIEVFAELRSKDPEVRAIVASGYAEAPVLANHEALGFAGMLSKPFEIHTLGRVLAGTFASRQELDAAEF